MVNSKPAGYRKLAWPTTKLIPILLLSACITFGLSSCISTKQLRYFQDLPDSASIHLPPIQSGERLIQANDRLHISFGGRDEQAVAIFNKYGGVLTSGTDLASTSANSGAELSGYLVDPLGYLQFPMLGKIRAEGLTVQQLKDTLTGAVRTYVRDPLVNVRFLSFKVTVLGEVKSPGIYNLPLQRTSLFDALGASGDLSRAGKRYDILLYRDFNGTREVRKIDLRKKDFFTDPNTFLLNNNDVVYVPPRKGLNPESAGVLAAILTVVLSAVTLVIASKN